MCDVTWIPPTSNVPKTKRVMLWGKTAKEHTEMSFALRYYSVA